MAEQRKTIVVFDLDDTLHMRVAPFAGAVGEWFGVADAVQIEKMFTDFRQIGVAYFHQWDAGMITEQEMYILRTIDTFALYGHVLSREEAAQFHRTYEKWLHTIRPAEGIGEALQAAVEAGLTLGILTNGSPGRQRSKIRVLGLNRWIPEETISVSLELGVHKPDPEVFVRYQKKICETWHIASKDEICWWYVGDLYENDIEPAARVGWHTIWMVHDNEDQTVPRELEPDHIVRNGRELGRVLRQIGESPTSGR